MTTKVILVSISKVPKTVTQKQDAGDDTSLPLSETALDESDVPKVISPFTTKVKDFGTYCVSLYQSRMYRRR